MTLTVVILIYVACGVLAYGRTLAHFQRAFPNIAEEAYSDDKVLACFFAAIGPCGLVVSGIMGKHGFMWRNPHNKGKSPTGSS